MKKPQENTDKLSPVTCGICKKVLYFDPEKTTMGSVIMSHKNHEHPKEMHKIRMMGVVARQKKAKSRHVKVHVAQEESHVAQEGPHVTQGTTSPTPADNHDAGERQNSSPPSPGKSGGDGHKSTTSPEQANVFMIRSQKYEIGSMLLLIAKNICETELNWPVMSVEDFLDTYFFETLKQRGFVIGAYQKIQEVQGAGT